MDIYIYVYMSRVPSVPVVVGHCFMNIWTHPGHREPLDYAWEAFVQKAKVRESCHSHASRHACNKPLILRTMQWIKSFKYQEDATIPEHNANEVLRFTWFDHRANESGLTEKKIGRGAPM